VLDVMPVEEKILGFSNPWYGSALDTATEYRLERRLTIRVATAPAFLATKWAAFASRGKDDLLGSRDLEDVITLVAGRGELVAEVVTAPADLRQYVAASTREFLADVFAEHAVEGALPDARILPGLVEQVTARLRRIAELR
jgi:predicted nucleotidyltransferase